MARIMKDSGIDWLGMIPNDWEVRKVKNYYKMQTGFTPDTKNPDFYDDEYGYDWVTIGDLNGGKYIPETTKGKISKKYVDEYTPEIIPKGSLLYSFKLSVGQVAFADRDVYSNEAIASFIKDENINLNFLFYSSCMIVENANENIYGAKILNQELIRNASIVFPPLEEQQKIADFLDDKVGEIDVIISKTKASIEEYKKYKQAVITEVALGGLDKVVTTKNSSIDWIGNIPEHWEIKPFKFVMTERNEKNIPVKTNERLALSIDKGITTYAEKTTNLDRFKDDVTQYKLAYEGDLVFNSMNMIVGAIGYSNYFGCVSPVYYTYYDNVEGHYTSKYYEYIFRSKTMRKVLFSLGKGIMAIDRGDDKINTCRLKVSRDDLRCLKVPVPTDQEQQEIVKYLDAKCAEIDALIAKKEAFVEEMEAYKKSLIYEYVTGKKEVL